MANTKFKDLNKLSRMGALIKLSLQPWYLDGKYNPSKECITLLVDDGEGGKVWRDFPDTTSIQNYVILRKASRKNNKC